MRKLANQKYSELMDDYRYREIGNVIFLSEEAENIKSRIAKKIAVAEFFQENKSELSISKTL